VRSLAWLAIGGGIAYVAIDVVLRFLRPGYSLLYNAESDYGRGPWYWVMDLTRPWRPLAAGDVGGLLGLAGVLR